MPLKKIAAETFAYSTMSMSKWMMRGVSFVTHALAWISAATALVVLAIGGYSPTTKLSFCTITILLVMSFMSIIWNLLIYMIYIPLLTAALSHKEVTAAERPDAVPADQNPIPHFGRNPPPVSEERFFYHSFPRLRPGDQTDAIIAKGLSILRNVKEIGLIISPEIVEWKQPLVDGTHRVTRLRQKRISFTELARSQVAEHGKNGPFSLEFKIDISRRMGALPVIYMPQSLKMTGELSTLGPMIVTQLGDIKYTITQLQHLLQITDPQWVLANASIPPGATVTDVSPDYSVNLRNTGDAGEIVAEKPVPARFVRDVIEYIGFKNAPFDLMIGVLSLVQTLFYPTDDETHDDLLSYYRQREWRIAGGFLFNGVAHGRPLTDDEKTRVLEIDERFWSREISDDQGSFRRIDEAVVIDKFDGKPISEFISHVLVPQQALEQARALLGNLVSPSE